MTRWCYIIVPHRCLGSGTARAPAVRYRRTLLCTPDGGTLGLDELVDALPRSAGRALFGRPSRQARRRGALLLFPPRACPASDAAIAPGFRCKNCAHQRCSLSSSRSLRPRPMLHAPTGRSAC